MTQALASAKPSARRWCKASPGCDRPTSKTPAVTASTPIQASGDRLSPSTNELPSATNKGALPRMMG